MRGKGLFHAIQWVPPAEPPDAEYPFLLMTGRVLYQYHTGTMTRRSAGLTERYPECIIEVNGDDAQKLDLKDGDAVRVTSRRGEMVAGINVGDRTSKGMIFIPFHFHEAAANVLTDRRPGPRRQNSGVQGLRREVGKGGMIQVYGD